ncbi:MAG: hypothetical protein ACD_87C00124G0002 [uncultured bacterium]|nr:MAG: hypothetical protein ACD_87C00124G0002 [uncultured bacterium]
MHPQVFFIAEVGHDRVRQSSVSDLNGVPVLDKPGHILPDALGCFGERNCREFQERLVFADNEIDILDMDEAVAVNPGHVRIDLGNNR